MRSKLVPCAYRVLLCGCCLGAALYVWWRIRRVGQELHRVGWDLEALAGALTAREKREGQ